MRMPKGALFIAISSLLLTPLPALAELSINIDKSSQRMTVSRDGEVLHTWPVSTGRNGRDTPSGSWKPFRMEKDHYSEEWDNAPMPNSIFFTKTGHAIHGSFEVKKLGTAASAGCVRLAPQNAEILWGLVKKEGLPNVKVAVGGQVPPRLATTDPVARDNPQQQQPRALAPQQQPGDNVVVLDEYGRVVPRSSQVPGQDYARAPQTFDRRRYDTRPDRGYGAEYYRDEDGVVRPLYEQQQQQQQRQYGYQQPQYQQPQQAPQYQQPQYQQRYGQQYDQQQYAQPQAQQPQYGTQQQPQYQQRYDIYGRPYYYQPGVGYRYY